MLAGKEGAVGDLLLIHNLMIDNPGQGSIPVVQRGWWRLYLVMKFPFSDGDLVKNDEEEVGLTVLHGITKIGRGILEGRSGGLTVLEQDCW